MKKNYEKPQLWTEAFQPADAVAGNCTQDVGFAEGVCTSEDFHYLFVETPVCRFAWKDEEGKDGHCYHTSQNSAGYFGS